MMRSSLRLFPIFILGTILLSCERSRTPVSRDTTAALPAESSRVVTTPSSPPAWDPAAGPVLFVRGGALNSAFVVFPQYNDSTLPDTVRFDETEIRHANLDLIGHSGALGSGRVVSVSKKEWSGDSCIEWPTAHLQFSGDSARATGWTIALETGPVRPVVLDSIEGMSPTDSARLAADVTRLVSALSDDTARTFRNIPFAVRFAYRFSAAPGVQGLVADAVRKLNQEANPLEQHTLLIAERDSGNAESRYRTVYHTRSAGSEETLETTDVLAALRFPNSNRVALVLLREGLDASAYALLERNSAGQWHVRWTSVHTGC